MNPDGTQDVNLRSWLGPDDNGKQIDERGIVCGGNPCTSPLKFTRQVHDVIAKFGTVLCGTENAADVNDRSLVTLSAEKWNIIGSKYGFTVKGGSYADLSGEVVGHGRECDADFGNYSDQFPSGRSWGRLSLWRADGSPIRVRCICADAPELVPGSGPYVFLFPKPGTWYHGICAWFFLLIRRNKWGFK